MLTVSERWQIVVALLCAAACVALLLIRWLNRRLFTEPVNAPPLAKVDGSAIRAMLWYARDAKGFLTWAREKVGVNPSAPGADKTSD